MSGSRHRMAFESEVSPQAIGANGALERVQIMHLLTRRKLGVLLAALAPVVLVSLALAGVRLFKMSSTYYEDTGTTVTSTKLHWSLVIPAGMFLGGIVLAALP